MTKNGNFALALDYLYKAGFISSQKDLFLKTGIAESSISKILSNKVRKVSDETIRRLNASFDNIFNPAFFRGDSNVMLMSDLIDANKQAQKEKEELQEPKLNFTDLFVSLVRSIEQELQLMREEREAMRQEREATLKLMQQLTASLSHGVRYSTKQSRYLSVAEQKQKPKSKAKE